MKLLIAAVGKLKEPEEKAIVARYAKRCDQVGKTLGLGPLSIVELVEAQAATAAARKSDEAQRLLKAAEGAMFKIARDAGGTSRASVRIDGPDVHIVSEGSRPIDLVRAGAAAIWATGRAIYGFRIPERLYADPFRRP